MQIIRVDRKNNRFGDVVFASFQEVFDYCLKDLSKIQPLKDDILYSFKILDSDEVFYTHGTPNGEDSKIYLSVDF